MFLAEVTFSDKVLFGVILFGFVGAPILALGFDAPEILASVLVGSAVSALVYRFLGGIDEKTTLVIGGLKLGGALAALVGVTLLVNNAMERQSRSRLVIEGTFKDLVKLGVSPGASGEPELEALVHRLEPVDRQMRLYAQEDLDASDLTRYDLEWVLVAQPETDVLKWEFQQQYQLPPSTEVVDPFVLLAPEHRTLRAILPIPLTLLDGRLDQILTLRYVESSEDRFRQMGRFLADIGASAIELPWEGGGTTSANAKPTVAGTQAPATAAPWGLWTRAAWAQQPPTPSIFDALEDPKSSRAVRELLGSSDLKRQILARQRLVALGPGALEFVQSSLAEPADDAYDPAILLHNLTDIVDQLAEGGSAVPEGLYSDLATQLYLAGAYEDAARVFDKLPGSEDPLLRLRRGVAYYQTQRYEEAVEEFELSLELGTDARLVPAARRNLGAACEKTQEVLEACRRPLLPGPAAEEATPAAADARSEGSGSWVLVGIWRPPAGFETVHFDTAAPPAVGDRIRALDVVHKRTDAPAPGNGWQQGAPIGVVAPGEVLEVLDVRRSGPENESIWARVVRPRG